MTAVVLEFESQVSFFPHVPLADMWTCLTIDSLFSCGVIGSMWPKKQVHGHNVLLRDEDASDHLCHCLHLAIRNEQPKTLVAPLSLCMSCHQSITVQVAVE